MALRNDLVTMRNGLAITDPTLETATDRELLSELIRRGPDRAAANIEAQLAEGTSVLRHALIVRRSKTKAKR